MIAHSLFKIFVSNLLLANWLRFLFGFLHPHTFSETLFSFQSTTSVLLFVKQTAFIFYQTIISLSRTFFDLFFLSCSSFFCFCLTTFKYITSLFTSLQVLFSFYLFSFLTCLFLSSRRISRSDFINLPYFLRFGKSCSSFGFLIWIFQYQTYLNTIIRIYNNLKNI